MPARHLLGQNSEALARHTLLELGWKEHVKGIWRMEELIFRGLFFEHNAACPVVANAKTEAWTKGPFMDGH